MTDATSTDAIGTDSAPEDTLTFSLDGRRVTAEKGDGREEDLDLLMDLCDNISPGVAWPPPQTTICVLGPSIPSSIASGIRMFRDEFLVHVKEGGCPFD